VWERWIIPVSGCIGHRVWRPYCVVGDTVFLSCRRWSWLQQLIWSAIKTRDLKCNSTRNRIKTKSWLPCTGDRVRAGPSKKVFIRCNQLFRNFVHRRKTRRKVGLFCRKLKLLALYKRVIRFVFCNQVGAKASKFRVLNRIYCSVIPKLTKGTLKVFALAHTNFT
jgi:hypothetical protein